MIPCSTDLSPQWYRNTTEKERKKNTNNKDHSTRRVQIEVNSDVPRSNCPTKPSFAVGDAAGFALMALQLRLLTWKQQYIAKVSAP